MIDGRTNTVMVAKYKPIRQGIMLTVRAIIATHQGVAVKARDGFVASEFDKTRAAKKSAHEQAAAKLPQQDEAQPRLSKRMAALGLCSRREADEWIVKWLGSKLMAKLLIHWALAFILMQKLIVSAYAMEHQAESVTILLHKPVGHVSGQAEDGYQPAIVLVHPDNEWLEDPDLNEHNAKRFNVAFCMDWRLLVV